MIKGILKTLAIIIVIGLVVLALYNQSTTNTPTLAYKTSAKCSEKNGLPDPFCTPGVIDPELTQSHICSGYYDTRPPTNYTEALKIKSIAEYNYNDTCPGNYEEDHLIPLELGGSATDQRNLWADPRYGDFNSFEKDKFENYLHMQVCHGNLSLSKAQSEIAANWTYYWTAAGMP